jgi:hypothetical protein
VLTGVPGVIDNGLADNTPNPVFATIALGGNPIRLQAGSIATGRFAIGSMSAVPLPAAAWLFGSALLGFMALSNRRAA